MNTKACPCCGWKLVEARGKYPGHPNRLVCPTCLAEFKDWIIEHNRADAPKSSPPVTFEQAQAQIREFNDAYSTPAPLAGGVALASDGQNHAETPPTPLIES